VTWTEVEPQVFRSEEGYWIWQASLGQEFEGEWTAERDDELICVCDWLSQAKANYEIDSIQPVWTPLSSSVTFACSTPGPASSS
jgi:hypothetical protein